MSWVFRADRQGSSAHVPVTPDSASPSPLLPSPSSPSRQPFLTGLGQEFRTLTHYCVTVSNSDWCLSHFQGRRKECLSLTPQEGAAVRPSLSLSREAAHESHFPAYGEIWKAPGARPALAGSAGLQPETRQSLLPRTALPGKPSGGLQSKPPSAEGGKEPGKGGVPPSSL